MAFDQISTSVSIISSGLKGYQAVSLTNFGTSAESVIAAGSAVEITNAFFLASGDITPQASTWTAITTTNTAYITLTPSGSTGSQILTAKYNDTEPVWNDQKQGWYVSSGSVIRYIGGVVKNSDTKYDDAFLLESRQGELASAVMEIGDWNMDLTGNVTLVHPVADGNNRIRYITVSIRDNAGTTVRPIQFVSGLAPSGSVRWGVNSVTVDRATAGHFNNATYDSTSFNRGWVTIWFER